MNHAHNFKDIAGQTFGHLTAVKVLDPYTYYDKKRKKTIYRSIWLFRCICGKEVKRSRIQIELHTKNPPSCGCQSMKGNEHPYWKGVGEFSKTHFTAIKNSSIRRKMEFNLTMDYLWDLFLKQKRTCAISGTELQFGTYAVVRDKENRMPTASLDRIDSTKGYVKGNVQWVHKIINLMKMDLSEPDFLKWCQTVVEHTK